METKHLFSEGAFWRKCLAYVKHMLSMSWTGSYPVGIVPVSGRSNASFSGRFRDAFETLTRVSQFFCKSRVSPVMLRGLAGILMLFAIGVGNAWGADETVTWSVSTTTANTISKDSGTLPTGASASMTSTDSQTDKSQLTSGKKQTFTLTGMDGCTIKGVTINMKKTNKGSSATVKVDVGSTSLQSGQTITLSTTARDKPVTLANTTTVVGTSEDVVITVTSNKNSAYVLKYKVTYEAGGGGTPTCATPTFSPASGSYIGTQSVTISSTTTGSTIYYTTDGSTPTTGSAHGTAGAASATVSVSSSQTLKAIAVKDGANDSEVATANYTIVSCDHDDFDWDLSTDQTTTASTEELTWVGTYASMSFAKENASTNSDNYYPGTAGKSYTSTRTYTGSVITITPASGVEISHVIFTATSDGYAAALRNSTWTNATASGSGSYVIVTPTDGTSAFSAAVGGTCGFTNVNVCYSACETLGSINGSIDLSTAGLTMTASGWSDISHASNYTVKLYKWNGSAWALANNNSTTGGASGAQATRTVVPTNNKSVTWSNLEYGAKYKVTVQAIGNGSNYCDGAETAVTKINDGADGVTLNNNEIPFNYSIYIDDATNANYAHNIISAGEISSTTATKSLTLLANKDYYQFKVVFGAWTDSGTPKGLIWWGNNGKMVSDNCTNWDFASSGVGNCKLQTTLAGSYIFTINFASAPRVSLTYPSANQDAGNIVYWDASIHGNNWSELYFRVGTSGDANASSNCKVAGQLVPGTDNFYKVTTAAFTGMSVWAITNKEGWTGSNTNGVYKTNTGDGHAITKSSAYQDYAVTATGVTLIPDASGSTGSQSHDNNCTFYPVTKTDGMLTHTATIGAHTNGTINIAYTDVSGTAQNKTATTAGLAHRTILTITSTPNTGYHQTGLTVNGNAFTSGQTHILNADATIAATYAINTYNITKGTKTGCSGNDFTLSASTVNHGGSITVTASPDASHKGSAQISVSPAGKATVSGTTISNITGDITVNVSFAAKEAATVKLHIAGSESVVVSDGLEGDSYTLPTTAAECPDMGLYGWYKGTYSHATTAPSGDNFKTKGQTVTLTSGENKFYAVYAEMNETANTYTKITTTDQLVTGDYLIVAYYSSSFIEAMANTVSEYDYMDEVEMKTFVNSTSNPTTINLGSDNPAIRWRITNNGSTVNFYNAAVGKYFSTGTSSPTLANSAENFSYSVSSGNWSFVYDNTYLIYTSNYYVGNTEDKHIYLFKRDVTMANYTTSPSCVTHDLTVVASPVGGGTATAVLTVLGEGKTTTATATPNSHYTFSHWTISGTEASMSNTVDNKSTDNPVTVTMGTDDATLTAHFTEKEKCTVVFKNNGVVKSSNTYWLGENPVAPTLTDGTDACDATSTTHYGWTQTAWPNTLEQAAIEAKTAANVKVYTKDATLPTITAGDDGTTITYHAVWAQGSGSTTTISIDGDGLQAVVSSISSGYHSKDFNVGGYTFNGSQVTKCTNNGTSKGWFQLKKNNDAISIPTLPGRITNISSTAISTATSESVSTGVYFNSSATTSSAIASETLSGATSFSLDVTGNNTSGYLLFGAATCINQLSVTYSTANYSKYLTTCCNKIVELNEGTLSHCTIAFSNDNPQTCSETALERQVTVTVTPATGYEMTSSARLTFTPTDGDPDPTATYKSGPTAVGATYQFVYEFNKDDAGAGTFSAECTAKSYTVYFDQSTATTAGTASVTVTYGETCPAIASFPKKTDYYFDGYYYDQSFGTSSHKVVNQGGSWVPNCSGYTKNSAWDRDEDGVTLYPKWTDRGAKNYRTNCPSFAVFNQDGTSAADIHLTSTKDVEIYASEAAGNLIRIIASGLDAYGDHPKIGVEYYDANNADALVTGTDRVFRLSNSSSYDFEDDLLDLGENTTEYDQTFSICYIPKDYNQSHHYKLKLILRNNNTEKDNVTIHLYGRSLPKEFVIAAKSGDTWYALPNTLAVTESAQGAITPTAITVDNATTPTKAVNPIGTVIYGACNKYTNDNRSGLRFTSDGAHWAQTSATTSVYKMWLSNTGYTNAQDWYLKSTDLSAYEVFMDPIGSPDDKRRIELYNATGVKMGYHNTGSGNARTGVGNIYLLPVEFPSITTSIMEWGTDHVVIDLRTPGSSTKVKTQVSGGTIGGEQALSEVKKDEGVYRVAVTLSSSDALKDLKLYFYDDLDVLQGVAAFTIPRIVSSSTTTGSFGTPFKKDAPFVDLVILNGATLTVSETTVGTKFTFRNLYVYGGGKMVVPTGTYIDFSNVYLRGGHLNASWNYVYSHPQLVLNGTMGNTSNTINYDYLTNNAQFYSLALPYDVTLSNIVNPDFNNKQSWLIHAYDGALRASGSAVAGWYDVEEGSTIGGIDPLGSSDALTAGMGYTFFGAMQKVNSIRQKWSVNRFPMTLASGSPEEAKSGVSVTAHGMTDGVLNDGVAPNDAGWNMLGNPFLADIGGTETYETAVKGTILSYHNVKTLDANNNWTGGWHWEENETNVRYVRIPNDYGTEYEQVRFKDAVLKAFHHFFIQAGASGTFSFDLSMRAQSMPQRIRRGKLLLPEEMDVDFRLSKGETNTKFGLTLSDDFSSDYVMNEDIAEDLSGESMKAYTLISDQRVTYNGLPFTAAQQLIPVGFRAPNAGEYVFSYISDVDVAEHIEHIYLTDKRLGVTTDLKEQSYLFASEIGVVDDRFILQIVFKSDVTTEIESDSFERENGRPVKFIYQGRLYIMRYGIIYDAVGRKVGEVNK